MKIALVFEWDEGKGKSNLKKHHVSFEEASTVFGDPLSLTIADPIHPGKELRFVTIGQSLEGKMLIVVHTDRGDHIRIISARKATRNERNNYEERED